MCVCISKHTNTCREVTDDWVQVMCDSPGRIIPVLRYPPGNSTEVAANPSPVPGSAHVGYYDHTAKCVGTLCSSVPGGGPE